MLGTGNPNKIDSMNLLASVLSHTYFDLPFNFTLFDNSAINSCYSFTYTALVLSPSSTSSTFWKL